MRTLGGVLRQVLVPLAAAVVLSIATYALTASNTVAVSRTGAGAEAITGFAVTNVHYTLDGTDPQKIASVAFDVAPAPGAAATMKARVQESGGAWYGCTANTASGITTLTCATTSPQAMAGAADKLTVVIGE